MKFSDLFVTHAGQTGLLPVLTEFFLVFTVFCFLGMTIFALATRNEVAPEHRVSSVLTAIICAVAGVSYLLIRAYYHAMLETLIQTPSAAARHDLIFTSYLAIGQYRYVDWAVTTPLLLLKNVLLLRVRPHEVKWSLATLLIADFLMVLTGYIGEQQLGSRGEVLAGGRYFWGTVSTGFYLVIPVILYQVYHHFAARAQPEERLAYRLLAYATVTTWGIYPIGYLVPAMFPNADLNWVHLAFSVADVVNKVGVGVIAYLAAAKVLEKTVPKGAVMPARTVG